MRPGALRRAVLILAFAVGMPAHANAGTPELFDIRFQSSLLSQFFKQPVEIGASVLLPDSYYKEPSRRYPVIYVVPAFEGTDVVSESIELDWKRPMRALGKEFIVVILQAMMNIDGESVHTQFADSPTNGPIGATH